MAKIGHYMREIRYLYLYNTTFTNYYLCRILNNR